MLLLHSICSHTMILEGITLKPKYHKDALTDSIAYPLLSGMKRVYISGKIEFL